MTITGIGQKLLLFPTLLNVQKSNRNSVREFGNSVTECWEWIWQHSEPYETNCKVKNHKQKKVR